MAISPIEPGRTTISRTPGQSRGAPAMDFAIRGLNHFAWRCRHAEQTRAFYEDLLGLPLAHVIEAARVPSTGEWAPYLHVFFRMGDGSYLAFFDLGDGTAAEPSP